MRVAVTYDNPYYEEHEEYTTTLAELKDSWDDAHDMEWVAWDLETSGKAVIRNGYATTTVLAIIM